MASSAQTAYDAPDATIARRTKTPTLVPTEPANKDGTLSDLESGLLRAMETQREDHKATVQMLADTIDRNSAALTDLSSKVARIGYLVVTVFALLLTFCIAIVAMTRGVDPGVAAQAAHQVVSPLLSE